MAFVDIRWENEEEKAVVEQLLLDWALYGQLHMTNAPQGHGITRLDPKGVTYKPTGDEVQVPDLGDSEMPSRRR